jgi:aromatic amino acid aminotransferase I
LKHAAKYLGKEGMISLGGGLPSSEYFPFCELSVKVPRLHQFSEEETARTGQLVHSGKYDLSEDKSIFDISVACNYGQGSGAAQLLRWVTEHTELVHDPPYSDWACNLTVGSTSGLDMAFRMFCQRGDYIISEEYTFSAAVESASPMGIKVAGVKMDEQGMLPDDLDHMLKTWDPSERGGARKPFVLYTVPTGQNPTGATQGRERRKAIYRVAQKHDLYILEDEPYYFLQMQPYTGPQAEDVPPPATHEQFLKSLVPSYLSMDVDGRVMRLDSFSKVISPGTRTGWITASYQITERYRLHADTSTQSPSGISQLLLFKLLDEHWGHDGYLDWLMHIRLEYTKRRDCILQACEKYLPTEFVRWVPPAAGMFHWLRIDWRKHPDAGVKSIEELEEAIFMKSVEHGALVIPGSWFYADQESAHDTLFFRATYAAAPGDRIEEAIRRFGEAVRESFGVGGGHGNVTDDGMKKRKAVEVNGHGHGVTNGELKRTRTEE